MKPKAIASLFYSGILISSLGTFAFNLSLVAFMLKAGFSLANVTLILALQRFVPTAFVGIWGHLTDNISPRRLIAFAEAFAFLASIALFFIWKGPETGYLALLLVCVIRSTVVSFQIGSRTKLNKFFSDGTYAGNAKQAMWFNKATQGATLFSGALAWVLITHFDLGTAIAVDAISFAINGVIAFIVPDIKTATPEESRVSWSQKFRDLFTINRHAAILDILLVASMMGTVAYTSRIAGSDQSWIGIYTMAFGLAVWTSGFLERSITTKFSSMPFLATVGIGCILLGMVPGPNLLTLFICFIRDCAYWIVFHRVSGHIHHDTPSSKMGGVSSARNTILVVIFASGEYLVGLWTPYLSLLGEGILRSTISALAIFYLAYLAKSGRSDSNDGRVKL